MICPRCLEPIATLPVPALNGQNVCALCAYREIAPPEALAILDAAKEK